MAKDYRLVAVIGFLVGWLVLVPAKNLGYSLSAPLVAGSVIGFTLFAPFALWILKYLARFWSIFERFGKFSAVGTLNSLIDLAVLNALMGSTGIVAGWWFVGFKCASFVVAKANSYFWNKFWTFESRTKVSIKEYLAFTMLTLVGAGINISVASILVNVVGSPAGMDPKWWANVSTVIAIFAGLLWNFVSYGKTVFKE
ncbi:MAG: GtrA family protein [Candidatus Jorgensenbacteria bacterium]